MTGCFLLFLHYSKTYILIRSVYTVSGTRDNSPRELPWPMHQTFVVCLNIVKRAAMRHLTLLKVGQNI